MPGVSRFDCFPSDFLNGLVGLTADQISAYTIMMLLQYDRGEPVPYVGRERQIAVRAGMSVGRLRGAIEHLRELGKLVLHADGCLENGRTTRELAKIERRISENRENSGKGGEATRKIWEEKRSNINDDEGREASQTASRHQALPSSPVPQPVEDPSDLCPNEVRTRHVYPLDFEEWWRDYPTDTNMSKATALKAWKRLTEGDRQDAKSSLSAYNRYCASRPDYRPLHAANYLSQRRWEGHLQTAKAVKKRIFVHRDSPQWNAWERHLKALGKRMPPVDQNGGWWFESEWPPKANEREHARMSA